MTLFSELPTQEVSVGGERTKHRFYLGYHWMERVAPGYLRAKVCSGVDGDILSDFAKNCIAPGSLIRSDDFPAYKRLGKEGFLHVLPVLITVWIMFICRHFWMNFVIVSIGVIGLINFSLVRSRRALMPSLSLSIL